MLVFMDLEWCELDGRICPTQLSALRVLPGWKTLARYDVLIKPQSGTTPDWPFVAYGGYAPEAFDEALPATTAFSRLRFWLGPKDVLCWWRAGAATTFITLYRLFLREMPTNSMRLVAPAVALALGDEDAPNEKSLYTYVRERDAVPEWNYVPHRSADDVDLLNALCRRLYLDEGEVLAHRLPPMAANRRIWELDGQSGAVKAQQGRFCVDLVAKKAHAAGCAKRPKGHATEEYATILECVRIGVKPCACCRAEYWKANEARAQVIIDKSKYRYVYSGGDVFHRTGCMHVKHIPFMALKGCKRYQVALDKGKRPCGWCRPKPLPEEDVPLPLPAPQHAETEAASAAPARDKDGFTRALTKAEKSAIRRHGQAAKERAQLADDADHDAFTLSRSGYSFWAAHGYRTFHLRQCPRLQGLKHLHGYATYADAVRAHLKPCRTCKPTAKFDLKISVPIYQQLRADETAEELDAICEMNGWKHALEDGKYLIETDVGKWKLVFGTSPVDVYHINKVTTPDNTNNYHRQHRLFLSMTDTLEYIRRHDATLAEKRGAGNGDET
ncbi:MAG: hypothetical protein E7317_05540 [Clostridiales bacterium]|nr:hypothetical protein [Clostridiales bacterium]